MTTKTTKNKNPTQDTIMTKAHNDFGSSLNSYAKFKISNKEMGEDMVQDTFTKTWQYLLKGGKISSMKSFLYHILNNLIIDEYRRRKHKISSLDTMVENGFEPKIDDTQKNSNIIDGKSMISKIKMLPKKYEKIIKMRFLRDLSLKEISAITGKTQNAIAVQIHRGVEKLRVICKVIIK